MLHKIKKFMALSFEQKRLFLEAFVTLGRMRSAILIVSFKHLTRSLKHSSKQEKVKPLEESQLKAATLVGEAIITAAVYTPWESACLVQSLTAQRMLQKRGIEGVFYLGAKKDEESETNMAAHAWSQCGDNIITGEAGHEEFTVLSVFGWGKE